MATDPRTIVNENQDPGLVHPTGYIPTQGVTNGTNEVKTVTINYTDPPLYGVPELQIFNDPGGRNGAVQFNVGNRLGGDSNFVWNSKNRTLSILGNIRISDSIIGKYNTNTKNLKIAGGEAGYVLSTDGTGNLSWVAQTGGNGNGVTDRLTNGSFNAILGSDGTLSVPGPITSNVGYGIESVVDGNTSGVYFNGNTTEGGSTYVYATSNVFIRANNNGSVQDWNFDSTGNLTLPGGGILGNPYGDNSNVAGLQSGPNGYAIINSNDQRQYVQADNSAVYIGTNYPANNHNWTFGTDGNLTTPSGITIGETNSTGPTISTYRKNLSLLSTDPHDGIGYVGTTIVGWVSDLDLTEEKAIIVFNDSLGNIEIGTGNSNPESSAYYWRFDKYGNVTLPGNTFSFNYANGDQVIISGQVTIPTTDTPPESAIEGDVWFNSQAGRSYIKYNDQWVDMSPQTVPPDPANPFDQDLNTTDNVTFNKISTANINSGGNIFVSARNSEWQFSVDGILTFPSGMTVGNLNGAEGIQGSANALIGVLAQGLNGGATLQWIDDPEDPTQVAGVVVNSPFMSPGAVQIATGTLDPENPNIEHSWTFDANGNITFPDGTVQNTAYTGQQSNSTILVSDTAPNANIEGRLWFNSVDGKTYVTYNNQWVDSNPQTIDAKAIRTNDVDNIEVPKSAVFTDGRVYQDYTNGFSSMRWTSMTSTTEMLRAYSDPFSDDDEQNERGQLGLAYQGANISGLYIKSFANNDSNTWTFEGTGNLRFPDDTVQTTAYQPATLLDGGGANSTYTSNVAPGSIPNPFDQELNTNDIVQFANVTAGNIIGNFVGISVSNVSGLGNIATVNLTGSSTNVLYGNGIFAPVTSTLPNVTTDNFRINGEGIGLIVDAADLKRFGFMKYSGIEGSLVHSAYTGAAVPLRIGRVSTANVTAATVNEFTTEIYVGTNGHVRIADDTVNDINDPTERLEVSGNIKTSGSIIFNDTTVQNTAWTGTISTANVTGLGNIATSNFDGVSSHVLYGNGTWANVGSANTGNISFLNTDIYSLNGITLENADLTYGATSALIIPSNGSTSAVQLNNFYGDIVLSASNSGVGGLKTWRFGSGNLAFPDLTIQNTAWTGTVSTSNVTGLGNIATVNLDGNSNSILYGNGVFAAAPTSGSTYSNSNVSTFLSSFGSNTISTTGNVSVGNINFSSNNYTLNFATGAYISGNANSLTRDGSILLQPYTGAGSTFPGVIIGGAGRLIAPNGGVFQIFNASDVTFQVPIKAPAYSASSTTSGGIQVTGGGGIGVTGNIYVGGNSITGNNAIVAGVTGTLLPNSTASFTANVSSYAQITYQNKSNGADATADFILTADNGNDTVNYLDMGIINSGYDNLTPTNSLGNIVYAADGYIYAQGNSSSTSQSGGNLAIGTTVAGKSVKIFAGGATSNSIIATISNTGVAVTGNVTATNFSGNISITGNVTGTSSNVTLVAGSYSATMDNAGYFSAPTLKSTNSTGNEGGEIQLAMAPNATISGSIVTIDQYVDRVRFFEGGGTTRGAYIDLSQAAAGVGTLLNNRVSGLVNAGTFVTMDLIKATVTSSGNRGLSLAATTGSFAINISGTYGSSGGSSGTCGTATITTTPSGSQFNWNFVSQADGSTYIITDTTNNRAYRITLQIGGSYLNNLITIERLV